jgi:hypothetical protein
MVVESQVRRAGGRIANRSSRAGATERTHARRIQEGFGEMNPIRIVVPNHRLDIL